MSKFSEMKEYAFFPNLKYLSCERKKSQISPISRGSVCPNKKWVRNSAYIPGFLKIFQNFSQFLENVLKPCYFQQFSIIFENLFFSRCLLDFFLLRCTYIANLRSSIHLGGLLFIKFFCLYWSSLLHPL